MNRLRLFALVAAAAALAGSANPARAGLLPVSVTVTPDAGNFRWTYGIVLPTDSQLRTGDYFTIYDFNGLIPGSLVQPDGWKSTIANLGPTPRGLNPHDDPLIPNLTWTYTGPTVPSGQIGLGNFWAISQYGSQKDSFFTATTHRTSDGKVDTNITETIVPVPAGPTPAAPEPATLALAALGLPVAGIALRRRRS